MQKFYAYIGLVATIALAVFLLYPFGQTYRIDATPFDNDAISAIIQSTSEIPKFMDEARRCISYSYTANPIPTEGDCTVSGAGPDILFIYNHSAQLSRYIPDIAERLDAIIDAHNPESPLITDDWWKDIVPLDPTAPVPEERRSSGMSDHARRRRRSFLTLRGTFTKFQMLVIPSHCLSRHCRQML